MPDESVEAEPKELTSQITETFGVVVACPNCGQHIHVVAINEQRIGWRVSARPVAKP